VRIGQYRLTGSLYSPSRVEVSPVPTTSTTVWIAIPEPSTVFGGEAA
jgi:hypothetical protein